MQDGLKKLYFIALVHKDLTHALIVMHTSKMPPQVCSDLTIQNVLPIDQDFKCDIGESLSVYFQ